MFGIYSAIYLKINCYLITVFIVHLNCAQCCGVVDVLFKVSRRRGNRMNKSETNARRDKKLREDLDVQLYNEKEMVCKSLSEKYQCDGVEW